LQDVDLNWIAAVVIAVVPMVLGAVWYSPVLFARPWMQAVGKSEEDLRGGGTWQYGVAVLAALVISYALARVVRWAEVDDLWNGALVGLLAWVGFVATTSAVNTAFAGRPPRPVGDRRRLLPRLVPRDGRPARHLGLAQPQIPSRSSRRSSRRQRGFTFTCRSRKTLWPPSASISGRARVPISFTICPPRPTRICFCDSVST
jgi:hypothetical protein